MSQSTPTASLGWQDFFTTTLDGAITSTDTTISLANAPTPTEGFLVIEPDSSTNREIIMYTSVSGNDVICGGVDDRGISGTTARAHSSGAIVKMNTVADMFEALQSGSGLSTGAITETKLGAGSVPNAKLKTGAGEPGGAWDAWTPTLSGRMDDADWTKDCKYKVIGKTVHYRISLTASAAAPAGGGSGEFIISLPVASIAYPGTATLQAIGNAMIFDANAGSRYEGRLYWASTTTAAIRYSAWVSPNINNVAMNATTPITWTTSDEILINGTYEAA